MVNIFNPVNRESTGRSLEIDEDPNEGQALLDKEAADQEASALAEKEIADAKAKSDAEKADLTEEEKAEAAKAAEAKKYEGLTDDEIAAKKKEEEDAAAAELTEEQKVALAKEDENKKVQNAIAEQRKEWLKGLGFTSEEELKATLAQANKKPETPEEIAEREASYQRSLQAFAIEKKILSPSDLAELDRVKDLTDRDLAFESFSKEYKELNKDRLAADGSGIKDPVTQAELEEEFENQYHINSENKASQQLGERQMKKLADELRRGPQEKFDNAKNQFAAHQDKQINIPAFKSFVKANVTASIPEHLVIGEGDNAFVFKLTNAEGKPLYDVEAIEKMFVNDPVFKSFLANEDKTETANYINSQVMEHLHKTNRASINKEYATFMEEVGLKKGSKVGAEAPFQEKKETKEVTVSETEFTPEQQRTMANRYSNPMAR